MGSNTSSPRLCECKDCKTISEGRLSLCWCQEKCFLGKGGYGKVYRGRWDDKVNVAVKVIDPDQIKYEIEILQRVNNHPNILKYYGETDDRNGPHSNKLLIVELCNGTLDELVVHRQFEFKSRDILGQIVKGLRHLHNNNIFHRDLNPRNILYYRVPVEADGTHRLVMKLADFGMSRIVPQNKSHLTRTQLGNGWSPVFGPFGTDGWTAPEILKGERTYTDKVDIYPLGLIIAFTSSGGRHPFEDPPKEKETKEEAGIRVMKRNERIKNNEPMILTADQLEDENRGALFELIQSMLSPDPKLRPSAADILRQKYFRMPRIIRNAQKEDELLKLCRSQELDDISMARFIELVEDDEEVDFNCSDGAGQTPFMLLCKYNKSDNLDRCVKLLLQRRDIDVNQSQPSSSTSSKRNRRNKKCNGEEVLQEHESYADQVNSIGGGNPPGLLEMQQMANYYGEPLVIDDETGTLTSKSKDGKFVVKPNGREPSDKSRLKITANADGTKHAVLTDGQGNTWFEGQPGNELNQCLYEAGARAKGVSTEEYIAGLKKHAINDNRAKY